MLLVASRRYLLSAWSSAASLKVLRPFFVVPRGLEPHPRRRVPCRRRRSKGWSDLEQEEFTVPKRDNTKYERLSSSNLEWSECLY